MAALALTTTSCSCASGPADCFGIEAARHFRVRLLDDAQDPTTYAAPGARLDTIANRYESDIPSCVAFDGVSAGAVVRLSNPDLLARNPVDCSTIRADSTLESCEFLESARDNGYWEEYAFTGPGAIFRTVSRGASVAGCSGTWMLDFDIDWLQQKYSYRTSKVWPREFLFDPGEAGGQAPVLAARVFLVDEGTSCPALGDAPSCMDVFLARFEPDEP